MSRHYLTSNCSYYWDDSEVLQENETGQINTIQNAVHYDLRCNMRCREGFLWYHQSDRRELFRKHVARPPRVLDDVCPDDAQDMARASDY